MPDVRSRSTPRERWAWYLYDFGNSAYAAVVLLAVYSAYFKQTVVGGAEGSRLWGIAVGIAMLVVAVLSPILGTIADFGGTKKQFLLVFTVMACVFTALLFWVEKGDVWSGMLFFILAEIGYRNAQVFYDALLPEIASPDEIGRISGNGWAIGSMGGIVCLLIVLPLIMFAPGPATVRLSFVITAVFFGLSAVPLFFWLRERAPAQSLPPGESFLSIGFKRLWRTLKQIKHYVEFVKFLLAFLIYNDGILMALDFAAILGAVLLGMNQQQLILLMILVQVTSVLGAYVFGLLADRWSGKRALIVSLLIMIGAVAWMALNDSLMWYFVIAGVAGFALTGVQSVSRSEVGLISPPGQSAEFYGFFSMAGRTSSFIGPAVYGWLAAELALWYEGRGHAVQMAEKLGLRTAMIAMVAFLVVGLILLFFVRENKKPGVGGKEQSHASGDGA